MEHDARIYVAGTYTPIGAALLRVLVAQGYGNVVGAKDGGPDLTDAAQVEAFFERTRPEYVFLPGGQSGGIRANQKYPALLMRDNLLVECNVIHSAYLHGVQKLLYLASSCCYPRDCPTPMRVDSLLTGRLEPTSEAYALAKIAGIGLCQAYYQQYGVRCISGIPSDAFGPGDDFSPEDSHVVPGLIRKMHEAKSLRVESVDIWGTGRPRRELIFADDLADACIFVMHAYDDREPVNLGGGSDLSIREISVLIKDVVGYAGALRFDTSKPDGVPVKVLDASTLLALGWRPKTPLRDAVQTTYEWFLTREEASMTAPGSRVAP
jgi:GDP-L-fucose synthase